MRFQPILLMTLPSGDDAYTNSDSDYTRPATPGMPNATGPMPSPYRGTSGAPPPPPVTGPAPMWRPAGQTGYTRAAQPTRPTGLLIVAGLLVAVALVALGGVALVLAQHNTPGNTIATHASATNTPKPTATHAPTATPTTTPTATPMDGNNQIPAPPDGFVQYHGPNNLWGMDIPDAVMPNVLTFAQETETRMMVSDGTQFNVYDLAQPVDPNHFQRLWDRVVAGFGVSSIPFPGQSSQIPLGTQQAQWMMWQTASTPDTMITVALMYIVHNGQATAIATERMGNAGDFAESDVTDILVKMLNSFTFLS